jgi:hypothetical protein
MMLKFFEARRFNVVNLHTITTQIMNSNLHADSMQQRRRNVFKQNHLLMNSLAKKCHPLGVPSQQGVDNNIDEMDRDGS